MTTSQVPSLTDLVPQEQLRELQDAFAQATGVACSLVRPAKNGHHIAAERLIPEANCTDFCRKFVRGKRVRFGAEPCYTCDRCPQLWCKRRKRPKQQCLRGGWVLTGENCYTRIKISNTPPTFVYLYRCFAGLWEIAAPIYVGKSYLGTIYAGQILIGDPTPEHIEHITKLAVRLKQNPGKMVAAFLRVHRLTSRDQLERIAVLLARMANQIAQIGMERLRSLRQLEMLVRLPTSHAVKTVAEMLDTESCAIFLKAKRRKGPVKYVLKAVHGLPQTLVGKASYKHGDGAVGTCAKRGITMRALPAECAGRYEHFLKSGQIRNLAVSPLRTFGEVVGVIAVANKRDFPNLTILDEKTLESAANHISRNMEHAITQADTEAARVFLARIVRERNLSKLRILITRELPRLVDADACTLFLKPDEFFTKTQISRLPNVARESFFIAASSKPVYVASKRGTPKRFFDYQMDVLKQAEFSYKTGEGLTGWVGYGVPICTTSRRAEDLRKLFSKQFRNELAKLYKSWWGTAWRSEFTQRFGISFARLKAPHWGHKTAEHKPRILHAPYAAVPLVRGDRVIGVIRLSGVRPGSAKTSFTTKDVALLTSCASQLIMALNSSKYVGTMIEAIVALIPHQIRGYAQRIKDTLGDLTKKYNGRVDWRLDKCHHEALSLFNMCGALMRYLNVEGGTGMDFKEHCLGEMIQEAEEILKSEAKRKHITLDLPQKEDCTVAVNADKTLVVHAVWNVLRNAINHAKRDTSVVCSIYETGNELIRVSVRNTGKEHFTEDNWDKVAAQGTAGLRLVKKIIQWHGGFVSCRGIKGHTIAEFNMDFPRLKEN